MRTSFFTSDISSDLIAQIANEECKEARLFLTPLLYLSPLIVFTIIKTFLPFMFLISYSVVYLAL